MDNIEIKVFLEAIFLKYGYDFRNYSMASIKRRLSHRLSASNIENVSALQHKVLHDSIFFETLLQDFSVDVTEMFRDPEFYLALRNDVVPLLKTYPFIKIWHAGCATGEEVYSMAILLKEEGLLERTIIYATDINEKIILKAREGVYPASVFIKYNENYLQTGGKNSLMSYFSNHDENTLKIDSSFKRNIVFSQHNLVSDGVFGEMNMILCRNVLIYFDKSLQDRAISLFNNSLVRGGLLCLGSKEDLLFSNHAESFNEIVPNKKIYQKKITNNSYLI